MEFLIRTRAGHDWPAVGSERMAEVLTPSGWNCIVVAGRGDHRLRCDDTEIAYSAEDAGWLLSVEGPMGQEAAEQLVTIVAAQVEHELDEAIEWLQIS